MESIIYLTVIRLLSPIFVAVAGWFFFRGHDLPGGGFIAGLILGVIFFLNLIADKKDKFIRGWINFRLLIGLGLLLVIISGLPGMFFKEAFLEAIWAGVKIPLLGKIGTPIFFDLGVTCITSGMIAKISILLLDI